MPTNDRKTDADIKRLSEFFDEDGPLAGRKVEYRRRSQQAELSEAVNRAFGERAVLLADAPTGTGKSLAYLAPAILSAAENGEKVVISTATLALQNQLLTDDIPPARAAAAELLGYPEEEGISYAVMKGRTNFLCTHRHQDTLLQGNLLEPPTIKKLDRWASETETGDREDLDFPLKAGMWREIASDGEDCSPNTCVFREGCFYYAHRDKAAEADVIVVNHALLLANAVSMGNIFDTDGRHLIIDEAHRLPEVMSEALGTRVSYPRVRYAMRQARKRSESAAGPADRADMAAELFFEDLRENTKLGSEKAAPQGYQQLSEALRAVRQALASDPKEEANRLAAMVSRLRRDLTSFYKTPETTHAYAMLPGRSRYPGRSTTRKPYPELKSWLVDTAEAFRDEVLPLFEDGGVILTSATLATGSGASRSFDYVRGRLGLDRPASGSQADRESVRSVHEYAGQEVFDYASRALIYTADDLPSPTTGNAFQYSEACAKRAEELVGISEGRALVLLSTGRAVSTFREAFRPPYPTRFQGDDSPGRLVRWLKETENAVLVGTRTFWEGIDVPGESVSMLVMDRVPFAPPDDPVVARLCEMAGKDWFRQVTLPQAQTSLRQGAGRLMRRDTDRGVIALLDPRATRKNWGKAALAALPPAPRTSSLAELRDFLRRH